MSDSTNRVGRSAPIDLPAEQFRALGYELVGRIAELLETIQSRPVGPSLSRSDARTLAG